MADAVDPISLRQYVDNRFEAQEKAVAAALTAQKEAVSAALAAADRAVAKAEAASDKRFESVNEFRSALNDNARLLMPRLEAERALTTIAEKGDVLTSRLNARDERGQGRGDVMGWIVGAVGLVAAVISIVFALTRNA